VLQCLKADTSLPEAEAGVEAASVSDGGLTCDDVLGGDEVYELSA
jgi:hypothetical protein